MHDQPPIAPYTVSDFLQWQGAKQLQLQPRFQRGRVWSDRAQSYLIDTIVRRLPIPPIVVRLKMDVKNKRTVREVVDGQQRLTAIFRFIENEIPVLPTLTEKSGGKYFDDLSEDEKSAFLSYKLAVWTIDNISDEEVLSIFSRLNTFVVPLNKQELRNATYFGSFKQSSYALAGKHLEFWRSSRVFSDSKIARMINVQFTSIMLITFERGIATTKSSDVDKAYKDWDEVYPNRIRNETRFSKCIGIISEALPDLSKTAFKQEVHFYSLVAAIYDAQFGLPQGKGKVSLPEDLGERLKEMSANIKEIAATKELVGERAAFQRAASRATADSGSRKTRHEFFRKHLFGE